MIRTMTTAANTLGNIQKEVDTTSHNIANDNTHGYQAKQAKFSELLYQQYTNDKLDAAPRESAVGIRYGVGAQVSQMKLDWRVGSLERTDRPLDFSLSEPKQYFNVRAVSVQEGQEVVDVVYTRKGNFYAQPVGNGQSMLVTDEGYHVLSVGDQPITFDSDAKEFIARPGGRLLIRFEDGREEEHQLQVSKLERPDVMGREIDGALRVPANLAALGLTYEDLVTDYVTDAERNGIRLEQGALEMSNVQMDREMIELIQSQRSYQMNARTVTLADQMLGLVNNLR